MPSFNPLTPLQTMDGHPLKSGEVSDPKARAAIIQLRGEWLSAHGQTKDILEVQLTDLSERSMDVLTVGSVMIKALTEILRGDEDVPLDTKLDNYELALRIRNDANAIINVTDAEFDNIKSRVGKLYPSALVIGQVLRAIHIDGPAMGRQGPLLVNSR